MDPLTSREWKIFRELLARAGHHATTHLEQVFPQEEAMRSQARRMLAGFTTAVSTVEELAAVLHEHARLDAQQQRSLPEPDYGVPATDSLSTTGDA